MEKFTNWCRHYNGLHSKVCRAGVSYGDVKDPCGDILHLPCFKDRGCTERCEKVSFRTPEEAAEEEENVKKIWQTYQDNIKNDICPHCSKPIQEKKQIGRCVYGYPCGHRLYQGTLPKQEEKPDTEQKSLF